MRRKLMFLLIIGAGGLVWAQAPSAQSNGAAPYIGAVKVLQGDAPAAPAAAPKSPSTHRKRTGAPDITGDINQQVIVGRQVTLPANVRAALSLSESWLTTGPPPSMGNQGQVVYVYGVGVPTVVCAILQVCEVDLEPGDTLEKDAVDWGDNRFEVATRKAGSGPDQFSYLVVKPTMPGLDTTMTIGTSKRPYYLRLVSTDKEHMARIAFTYPEEERKRKEAELAAKQAEGARLQAEAERLKALDTQKAIRNWEYDVQLHGKDASFLRPSWIGDDGVHTYLQLGEEARHRGLPVIEISDARGPIPANSSWRGNELVVDAVFQQACLLEGVGKKQQRACIRNKGLNSDGQQH